MERIFLLLLVAQGIYAGSLLGGYNYYNYWGGADVSRQDVASDERVWRFMIGSDWGAYEYLDENGYMKGFHPDLIKAVCTKAGKTCYWMIDSYQNCWNTQGGQQLPGVGLMGGWYDGCVGINPTPERMNSFNFTKSWTEQTLFALFYRKDKEGDSSNLKGRTIGLMNGWASGRSCLAHQLMLLGNQPDDYTAVYFDTTVEIVKALEDKEVDAIVLESTFDAESKGFSQRGPILSCTVAGASVMTLYGSPVLSWWDEAYDALVASGEFDELCRTSQKIHGAKGRIDCI